MPTRVVVLDTSLKSLQAGDPFQNPGEPGGQLQWLTSMLCLEGSATDTAQTPCTRTPSQPAIVVSTTPTYSYGPGGLSETQTTDGTQLEQILLANNANLVVSGHLGWNGLYYARAAGVHDPCPGGAYPGAVPDAADPTPCGQDTNAAPTVPTNRLANMLTGTGAPAAPAVTDAAQGANTTGLLPFVVASGAGGKFAPEAAQTDDQPAGSGASNGYWHGYTIIRLDKTGDPRLTIVEQRPLLDWVSLQAPSHVLRPGQKMTLRGFGREPVALDQPPRYDTIDSPAITHRYDLLEADPDRPYLPRKDANGDYVRITDPGIASIDRWTGKITAGRGNHGRIYALAVLSVGDQVATWTLSFEPKRSYVAKSLRLLTPVSVPAVRVLGFSAQSISAPPGAPPSSPPPPINTSLQLPTPPALPNLPGASASPTVPPVPPAPPAPPAGQQGLPITLSINPAGLTVPPTTGVTAQPTPPVNPSPPGGARKEARQRQAATAKSEEGSAGGEAQGSSGDLAQAPDKLPGAQMTRRDRVKPAADGFTPLDRPHAQPSAWTTGLEWGGGIGLMSLILALGFATLRPTPRSRPPVIPAPAWAWARRRRW